MAILHYTDHYISQILQQTRTIVILGASAKPDRASHKVMRFLQEHGYRVIPVNNQTRDSIICGEKVYTHLDLVPESFQMVDIFRNIDHAIEITEKIISLSKVKGIRTIWMQLGIRSSDAYKIAKRAGINIIMDRCPAIEIKRLSKLGLCNYSPS